MDIKEIKKIIRDKYPTSRFSNKKGGFVFTLKYYWGITKPSEPYALRIAEELKALGLNPTIVNHSNNYKPWPKDSYFEAVISIN